MLPSGHVPSGPGMKHAPPVVVVTTQTSPGLHVLSEHGVGQHSPAVHLPPPRSQYGGGWAQSAFFGQQNVWIAPSAVHDFKVVPSQPPPDEPLLLLLLLDPDAPEEEPPDEEPPDDEDDPLAPDEPPLDPEDEDDVRSTPSSLPPQAARTAKPNTNGARRMPGAQQAPFRVTTA